MLIKIVHTATNNTLCSGQGTFKRGDAKEDLIESATAIGMLWQSEPARLTVLLHLVNRMLKLDQVFNLGIQQS